MIRRHCCKRTYPFILLGISCTFVCLVIALFLGGPWFTQSSSAQSNASVDPLVLPLASVHPLPVRLEEWSSVEDPSDYFLEITPARFGYLVWSDFPIHIYLESSVSASASRVPTVNQRQQWSDAINRAIAEWSVWLPMDVVSDPDAADITFLAQAPPLRWDDSWLKHGQELKHGPEKSGEQTPQETQRSEASFVQARARTAETTYSIALTEVAGERPKMVQRYQISLSPYQTLPYMLGAARHELGHALGIWGHSPVADDALYFSQTSDPAAISTRDINTLKRIYQQPTQLGWPLVMASELP